MTLEDIRQLNTVNLTPAQAAEVLGVNPHSIRIQAQNDLRGARKRPRQVHDRPGAPVLPDHRTRV